MKKGFTLAELLIALGILGVIATFTIPKILASQQQSKWNAIGKEAISMIAEAYQAYKVKSAPSATTRIDDIVPYMNYVRLVTTGAIDARYGTTGTVACNAFAPCILLHNGAMINHYKGSGALNDGNYFGQASANYYVYFIIDPDGQVTSSASTTGPGKSLEMRLYFNGAVKDWTGCVAGDITYESGAARDWCPLAISNPDWFNWN